MRCVAACRACNEWAGLAPPGVGLAGSFAEWAGLAPLGVGSAGSCAVVLVACVCGFGSGCRFGGGGGAVLVLVLVLVLLLVLLCKCNRSCMQSYMLRTHTYYLPTPLRKYAHAHISTCG